MRAGPPVRNHSSASAGFLANTIGGTQTTVNASIIVERIGTPTG